MDHRVVSDFLSALAGLCLAVACLYAFVKILRIGKKIDKLDAELQVDMERNNKLIAKLKSRDGKNQNSPSASK